MQPRAVALVLAAVALPLAAGAAAADSILDIVMEVPQPVVDYADQFLGDMGGMAGDGTDGVIDQLTGGQGLPFTGDEFHAIGDSIADGANHDLGACPTGAFAPHLYIPWAPDHVPELDGEAYRAAFDAFVADPAGNAVAEGQCRFAQALTGALPEL